MLERKVSIGEVKCAKGGTIFIQFKITEGGEEKYHRTSLQPGVSLADQIALVNVSLAQLGFPAVPDSVVAGIKGVVDVEHTPEVIARFAADRAAAEAAIAARGIGVALDAALAMKRTFV